MNKRIYCEYCNKEIYVNHKTRHQNSKLCRNKQQNLNIKSELKEYKCIHCNKSFNRSYDKNEHEYNIRCNAKDIMIKLKEKNKENDMLKYIKKQKNITN